MQLACPDWTAEDYGKDTPYAWLYEQRNNKFLMVQLLEVISKKAGSVGVKNFKTIWRAYVETRNEQAGIMIENATNFEGQPLDLACDIYTADDAGITYIDHWGSEVVVCPHPIMPVQRLINIDSGEVKTEIAFKRGKKWQQIIFDKGVLASGQKIIEMAKFGVAVDSENARDMVKYLSALESLNYDKIPEINSVGRLGWIEGYGFSPYVENLRFDGEIGYKSMFDAVAPKGHYKKWLEIVKDIRKNECVLTRLILAASFASALVQPCAMNPFYVHLWGGSGAGKTVGLMLAASVWASPVMGEYIHTYDGTAVSQELMAGFCNSLPLCIDELQIVKDKRDNDSMIYKLCEGVGRGRGAKGGGLQRVSTWKNCTLSTGEMPILTGASGGGAVNRVLEIDCKDVKLFKDGHSVVVDISKNYGHAGKQFIQEIIDKNLFDEINSVQDSFYTQLMENPAFEKQAQSASLILTADWLSNELIFQDDCLLTMDDLRPFLVNKEQADPNRRAYEWITDFVASNPQRFNQNAMGEYSGECWGEIGSDQVYIIKSVFDRVMTDAGFSSTAFLGWAKRHDLIKSGQGHNTIMKRMKGLQTLARCVCLKLPDEFDAAIEGNEE